MLISMIILSTELNYTNIELLNQEHFRLAIYQSYLAIAVKTGNKNSGLSDASHKTAYF